MAIQDLGTIPHKFGPINRQISGFATDLAKFLQDKDRFDRIEKLQQAELQLKREGLAAEINRSKIAAASAKLSQQLGILQQVSALDSGSRKVIADIVPDDLISDDAIMRFRRPLTSSEAREKFIQETVAQTPLPDRKEMEARLRSRDPKFFQEMETKDLAGKVTLRPSAFNRLMQGASRKLDPYINSKTKKYFDEHSLGDQTAIDPRVLKRVVQAAIPRKDDTSESIDRRAGAVVFDSFRTGIMGSGEHKSGERTADQLLKKEPKYRFLEMITIEPESLGTDPSISRFAQRAPMSNMLFEMEQSAEPDITYAKLARESQRRLQAILTPLASGGTEDAKGGLDYLRWMENGLKVGYHPFQDPQAIVTELESIRALALAKEEEVKKKYAKATTLIDFAPEKQHRYLLPMKLSIVRITQEQNKKVKPWKMIGSKAAQLIRFVRTKGKIPHPKAKTNTVLEGVR